MTVATTHPVLHDPNDTALARTLGHAGLIPFVLLAVLLWLVNADLRDWVAMALAGGLAGAQRGTGATTPNSVCADCHDSEAKLNKSAHVGVLCASCHLKREEYPHPENAPKPQCSDCHATVVAEYNLSNHALELKKGNAGAPDCAYRRLRSFAHFSLLQFNRKTTTIFRWSSGLRAKRRVAARRMRH